VAAFLFFISSQAETGRAPFDLIEAESELTAGFNVEYSGMKFAMFFAGEFMHVFTNGVLMAVLFTGGWQGLFARDIPLLGLIYLLLKSSVWYLLSLLMRNALPRVRIDQLMAINWKFLVPLSIVNLLVTAFLLKLVQEAGIAPSADEATDFAANIPQTVVLLVGNILIIGAVMTMFRNQLRAERRAEYGLVEDELIPAAAGD